RRRRSHRVPRWRRRRVHHGPGDQRGRRLRHALRPDTNAARATLSGLCSSLVGIGLARFAYTPLIPALIAAEWFSPGHAAYLGAANLAGYLAGALVARPIAARLRAVTVLRAMMVIAAAAFFACATPRSFVWYFVWRFAAGVSGGTLMALAAPTVMPHVPPARRGLAGGAGYWVVFGLGAMVGPVLAGQLADRIGFARAVRLALLAQAAAVAALVVTASPVALFVSSAIVGALVPGIVPLVLGRVH